MASSGEWPSLRHPQTALVGWEAQQPPLYYLAGAATYRAARALGVSATDLGAWLNHVNDDFFWKSPVGENNFFHQAGTSSNPTPRSPTISWFCD